MTYAKQVPYEWQESPMMYGDEFCPDDVAFVGNRDYKDRIPDYIKNVFDELDEVNDFIDDVLNSDKSFYKNVTEVVNDLLRPTRKLSTRAIAELKHIFLDLYGICDDKQVVARVLSVLTGDAWKVTAIRGCCQGDWQEIIYNADKYSYDDIRVIETEYFNTGTEWFVYEDVPDDAQINDVSDLEDYCPVSYYCYTCDPGNEIAERLGVSDIIVFEFDGMKSYPTWRVAQTLGEASASPSLSKKENT